MTGWDEDTEPLAQAIDAGLSMSQAARLLAVSRSAVAGRSHRLGWRFGRPVPPELRTPPPSRRRPPPRRPAVAPEDRPISISTRLDPETYAQVRALADEYHTTVAAAVRALVEWGLEAAERAG